MKVTVMKKATVTNLTHGVRFSTDVEKYDNVTNITEVTESANVKLYQLTYTHGSSTSTAQYNQNDYLINILQ